MFDFMKEFDKWKKYSLEDADLIKEIENLNEVDKIKERFIKDLEFGTAGLRGEIGVGTNRMNIYVVRRTTQALADYVNENYTQPSVSIAYDSRHKSDLFSKEAAKVLVANGIRVYLYDRLMPTPLLSWAVRYFESSAGIMITASHNPRQYNGYKAYDNNGCQIGEEIANDILARISKLDTLNSAKIKDFDEAIKDGSITYINQKCIEDYYSYCKGLMFDNNKTKNIKIVYSAMNGCGYEPVTKLFDQLNYKNVDIVKEQAHPDGDFTTANYPNPETKEAMSLGMKYQRELNSDIFLATDPDCDRCNASIMHNDEIVLLNGNQIGIVLFNYIYNRRLEAKTLPSKPFIVKTIVSTDLVSLIAKKRGVEVIETLTGFKYIGEAIEDSIIDGQGREFIFGFEESIGFLSGTQVRDKDAVNSTLLIAEAAQYYKDQNKTFIDVLDELYKEFGYHISHTEAFSFPGLDGMKKMDAIIDAFRNKFINSVMDLEAYEDYLTSKKYYRDGHSEDINLPKSNVLSFYFKGCNRVLVRPSGTEPKLKIYFMACGENLTSANEALNHYKTIFENIVKTFS